MFRLSSRCTFSYFKVKHTIYNVFCFCQQISCTSTKSAFKITTVAVEIKSYSKIKDVNSITAEERPLRNICQELTITTLPDNQFTLTPQKSSVAKQEYTQFDTITPPSPPEVTHPTFYTVYILYLRITF